MSADAGGYDAKGRVSAFQPLGVTHLHLYDEEGAGHINMTNNLRILNRTNPFNMKGLAARFPVTSGSLVIRNQAVQSIVLPVKDRASPRYSKGRAAFP
jgi:hypothetical protein